MCECVIEKVNERLGEWLVSAYVRIQLDEGWRLCVCVCACVHAVCHLGLRGFSLGACGQQIRLIKGEQHYTQF